MNRRTFLTVSSLTSLVGCGRSKPTNVTKTDSQRHAHLELLKSHKVPADAVRTTVPRPWRISETLPLDLFDLFPELRTRSRVAIRLHPRYSDEPGATESKLGGIFAWPAGEPWPEEKGHPYLPIVQLRKADCPPNLKFQPGSDLLQILLNPKVEDKALLFWRELSRTQPPFAEPPTPANPADAPVPCRFFPERVADYPYIEQMPESEFKERIKQFKIPAGSGMPDGDFYRRYLASIPGHKVGGFIRAGGSTLDTTCPKCQKAMDFVMTLAHDDWDNDPRWAPVEERTDSMVHGYSRAPDFPREKDRHIFNCTRCVNPPSRVVAG